MRRRSLPLARGTARAIKPEIAFKRDSCKTLEFPEFWAEYFCNPLLVKEILFFVSDHRCPFASMLSK